MLKKLTKNTLKEHAKNVIEGVENHHVTKFKDGHFKVEATTEFPEDLMKIMPKKEKRERKERGDGENKD